MGIESATRGPISSGQSDVPDVTQGNPGIGKTRLTHGLDARSIGDNYIQGQGHCTKSSRPDCFLDEGTRSRLVSGYQARVTAAAGWYGDALTQLRVDQLISKDEEVGMVTSLIIDALGGLALKGITRAAKWLRSADASSVFNQEVGFAFDDGSSVVELLDKAKSANESHLNLAVKGAAEQGKRAVTKAAASAASTSDEFEHQKAVGLSYVDQLAANAAIAFQHQREDPPSVASDAELILLYHSWSVDMGHTVGMYKAELQAKLDRFKASPASKIGRTSRSLHHGSFDSLDGDYEKIRGKALDTHLRDTKLGMEHYTDGSAPELVYYKKDYRNPMDTVPDHLWKDRKLDLDPAAEDNDFKPYKSVEKEFTEAAIAQNEAAWGVRYEARILPPKIFPQWKSDKPRNQNAVATPPASEPSPVPAPKPLAPQSNKEPMPAEPHAPRQPTMLDVPLQFPAMNPSFADLPIMVTE